MSDTLVSVLMPVFNGAPYLRESVESLLNQDHQNFELIMIDDGSIDETWDIIQGLARRDHRIRPFRNGSNRGLTRCLNDGLQLCTGEYIARLDADDIATPNRLSTQINHLKSHPNIGLVGSFLKTIEERPRLVTYPTKHFDIVGMLAFANSIAHPSIMFRRSLITVHGVSYPDIKYAQDYGFYIRCASVTELSNLPVALTYYRIHSSQISSQKKIEQDECRNEICFQHLAALLNRNLSDLEKTTHLTLMAGNPQNRLGLAHLGNWTEYLISCDFPCRTILTSRYRKILLKSIKHNGPKAISGYFFVRSGYKILGRDAWRVLLSMLSWSKSNILGRKLEKTANVPE